MPGAQNWGLGSSVALQATGQALGGVGSRAPCRPIPPLCPYPSHKGLIKIVKLVSPRRVAGTHAGKWGGRGSRRVTPEQSCLPEGSGRGTWLPGLPVSHLWSKERSRFPPLLVCLGG